MVLIEVDQLLQLALWTVVAPREQRLDERVVARVGLDENAFAGLTVSVRRAERGRLQLAARDPRAEAPGERTPS